MKTTIVAWILALTATLAAGHDMFLVVPEHQVAASSRVTVSLYNGTFEKSENTIDRERMIDVSVVDGVGEIRHPAVGDWRDEGAVSLLELDTGPPGTYVVGVSTKPRLIELSAEDFNDYLRHDGVLDVLEERGREGALDRPATERYSKHVKTILQAGDVGTETYSHRLGYPIEIVPRRNPLSLAVGDTLECLVLANGEPVAGQLVYASHEGFHTHDDVGAHREAISTRTDGEGVARIEIIQPGRWYVRLIRMVSVEEPEVDYESNWATLTFEVGH